MGVRTEPISASSARYQYAARIDPRVNDPTRIRRIVSKAYEAIRGAMAQKQSVIVPYVTTEIYDDEDEGHLMYARAFKAGKLAAEQLRDQGYTVSVERRVVVEPNDSECYEYYLAINWEEQNGKAE
jgi:hypothetical protein